MSVDFEHEAYAHHKYLWKQVRDVVEGRDALLRDARVRTRTNVNGTLYSQYGFHHEEYVPRLKNQSQEDYYRYVERGSFFGASARTIDALTGLLFAKTPTERLPDALMEMSDDITTDGVSLREFAAEVAREELTTSRVGILVDYPTVSNESLSVADAERLNLRPYMTMFKAEQIVNWRCEMFDGRKQLTLVVLKEKMEIAIDEFQTEYKTCYRVLDLFEGSYRVRIMSEEGDIMSEAFPQMNGSPMRYLPFLVVNGPRCRKPILMDLISINVSHYRNSCDYEHGLHFTGLPTPYVSGVQLGEGETLQIGSNSAWVFPDPSASANYLEFKGSGLKTLSDAMKEKEQRMAVLGAKMLVEEKRMSEAVQTVEMRTAGERSILADVAYDVSDALETALKWMASWEGIEDETIDYQINIDFGARAMQPQMLQALMQAVQGDMMPMRVFFENLKRGELVHGGMEFDEYENEIQTQAPSFDMPVPEQNDDQNILGNLRNRLGL